MFLSRLLAIATACATVGKCVSLTDYEYIVVGSGAGGGPLAARLAMAGHKTLLIEAGDDQGLNFNYSVPAYNNRATEDPNLAWDFFVRHYADDERQARDWKTSYDTPGGGIYTGLSPPPGSKMKGVLYPRAGTLGGCTAHNALIAVYPHRSDFQYIANLTGDDSWSPDNMRNHFVTLEKKQYSTGLPIGHGTNGWLTTELAPLTIPLEDPQFLSLVTGGAFALGNLTNQVLNVTTFLAGDLNADTPLRDKKAAYYQVPISTNNAVRTGSRDFIVSVRDAVNANGSKKYPLDVRLNCHVTKVLFDTTVSPPRATGVAFLDGARLYRASPLSASSNKSTPGSASATREVIVSGGTYNSPQLLKLSGIGPAAELARHEIPLLVDLPGVGANLQDHYETSVQAKVPMNWLAFNGCSFSYPEAPDACFEQWQHSILGLDKGTYASDGFVAAMLYPSTSTTNGDYDTFVFGGPVNFRGYYPGYSREIVGPPNNYDWWSWAILKAHPRNTAGSVMLRSADPLDVPNIVYNYFETGTGDSEKDLQALYEGVQLGREALARQVFKTNEVLPGAEVQAEEEVKQYVKDGAWGHHASCTCAIGPDGDKMAVLDSKFRVRGTQGLRVVDASVYPKIPGTFTAVSTYLVAEKAAVDILGDV
ncbi:GMC oxidoreductase [Bombardia bombarda]|uniref:GMC oxidoreductase n=1 Tax=Bombardia bombarda TaxID=252184 RepID=A0AA39WUR1_9PEZI|nr:GMC oxidoreductase [Bombardia bombarda]